MAKSVTYNKRENEKKKQARRVEKQKKKEDRKLLGKANSFDDMIAYAVSYTHLPGHFPEQEIRIRFYHR